MAVVISFMNMKGGVDKTTVASQLAHGADADGLRVLAVDLDPQSNLSQSLLGPSKYIEHCKNNGPTIVQILDDYVPANENVGGPRPIHLDDIVLSGIGYKWKSKLDLIPSRLELSRVLKKSNGKERMLAQAIGKISEKYDLVIIDCAPTESILTDAAYFSSRFLAVPIKTEFLATIGLPLLARSLDEFREQNRDHRIDIAGIVLNEQSDYANNIEKSNAIDEVRDIAGEHGWRIFDYQIPYSRSCLRAARSGLPLSRTPHARSDRIDGFGRLKDDILAAVGLQQ